MEEPSPAAAPDSASLAHTHTNYKRALHQAILLKARNPHKPSPAMPTLSTAHFTCTMPPLAAKPKPAADTTDLLTLATSQLFSQLGDELSLSPAEHDELDTPLNINQNLTSSLRGLRQPLDAEEEASGDVIVIGSLLPSVGQVRMAIPLKASHTNINIPKLPIRSINLLASNSLSRQLGRIGKRLKDEALSNSSSSDEEDQQQQQQSRPRLGGNRLQQLVTSSPKVAASRPEVFTCKRPSQGLVSLPGAQPKITPVVSAAERQAACQSPSLLNQSMESSSSDLANCSKSSPDLSFSCLASPTSSANNDSAIDLHDDNSSTASGPIYVRQPGFEQHAHEVQIDEQTLRSLDQVLASTTGPVKKPAKKVNEKNISFLTSGMALSTSKPSNKAKKKLCMMIGETVQGKLRFLKRKSVQKHQFKDFVIIRTRLETDPEPCQARPASDASARPSALFLATAEPAAERGAIEHVPAASLHPPGHGQWPGHGRSCAPPRRACQVRSRLQPAPSAHLSRQHRPPLQALRPGRPGQEAAAAASGSRAGQAVAV